MEELETRTVPTAGPPQSDSTFGSAGTLTYAIPGSSNDALNTIAIQNNHALANYGDIYAAGSVDGQMAIVRFLPSGAVDSTFGSSGHVLLGTATFGLPGDDDEATAIAIHPSGRIVVAGDVGNLGEGNGYGNHEFAVIRLLSNGNFLGHTDVKELALYIEDQIKAGNWNFNLGIRGDVYNGLTATGQAEPRVGISYNIKPSGTVLSVSYARTLETPFNENLVLSSSGCLNAILSPLLACTPGVVGTLDPGYRNEFHAGFQQAIGKRAVVSGEYIWKYTHNAFDFSVLGNTPITFPIDWHNSKIPGYALHVDIPEFRRISAYVVMSSVAARFFPPQSAGAGATVGQSGQPFRIDHDEKFNQTSHLQYQIGKRGPWAGFNWRYDSGLVAGAMPFASDSTTPVDLTGLSNDQQFEAGISCNGQKATPTSGFQSCLPSQYTSSLVSIPAPGMENDDKNPPRIAPRNLFDATVGKQNIFHAERYKVDMDVTAINLTDKYALYNFLSTFSGTHYVTPRALTAKVTLNF